MLMSIIIWAINFPGRKKCSLVVLDHGFTFKNPQLDNNLQTIKCDNASKFWHPKVITDLDAILLHYEDLAE